jgi:hypothetical protein
LNAAKNGPISHFNKGYLRLKQENVYFFAVSAAAAGGSPGDGMSKSEGWASPTATNTVVKP